MRYAILTATHLSSHDDQKSVIEKYSDGVIRHILWTKKPGAIFPLIEVIDAPEIIHLARATRRTYTHLILSNLQYVFPHDSGPIIKQCKHSWKIPTHDAFNVTATDYADMFLKFSDRLNRDPETWEMDRILCTKAGKLGHYACGWCNFHKQPILICGCRNRDSD